MMDTMTMNVWAVLAGCGILAMLARLAVVVPGREQVPAPLRVWLGWSVAVAVLTLWGVLLPWRMEIPSAGLLLAAMGLPFVMTKKGSERGFDPWALLVVLPLVVMFLGTQPVMWDDFAHRLPNTRFLWDFGRFPHPDLPPPSGNMPAYPYAGNWLGAWVNMLLGRYVDTGQAMMQVLLFGLLAAWAGMRVVGPKGGAFVGVAVGLLLLGVSPVFSPELLASAYNDMTLGWAVWLAAFLGVETLRDARMRWPFAMLLALCVMLKDTGVVVAAVVGVGTAVVGLRQGVPLGVLVRRLGPAAGMSLLLFGVWQLYVRTYLPVPFVMRGVGDWNWAQGPAMMAHLGTALAEKPQQFLPLFLLAALACVRWKRGRPVGAPVGLALGVGAVYAVFLAVMYLAAFSPLEGANLASLDRYLMHVNWLAWGTLVLEVGPVAWAWVWGNLRGDVRPWVKPAVVTVALVAPVLAHGALRIREDAGLQALRTFAQETLVPALPAGAKVVVLDMRGSGYAAQVLTYELGHRVKVVRQMNMFTPQEQLQLADYFKTLGATHLLVLSVNDDTAKVLGGLPKRLPQLYACAAGTLRCEGMWQ